MGSEPSVILSDFQTIVEYEIKMSYEGTREEEEAIKGALIDENFIDRATKVLRGKCLFCYFQSIQG